MTSPGYQVDTGILRSAAAQLHAAAADLLQGGNDLASWTIPDGTFTMMDKSVQPAYKTILTQLEAYVLELGRRFDNVATGLENVAACYDRNKQASIQVIQGVH